MPALRGGHRPERGQDLPCRHPRLHLTVESGRRLGQRGEGGAVDRTVLAHLEGSQVEPERLHLPAQVLQRTVGHPPQPVVRERLGQLGQLGDQRLRPFVASPLRTRQGGQVGPRPVEPLGDGAQAAPVGLPREAPLELAHRLGKVVRIGEEAARDRGRRRSVARLRREVDHEPRGSGSVAVQDVVGLDPERFERRLGGHEGMAVAVATDPGAPAEKRRHARRPGPGAPGVGGGGPPGQAGGQPVERRVERAVEPGRGREERRVEEHERRAHLVERRRPLLAEVGRAPQDGDLLAQPPPQLGVTGRGEARVVQIVEQGVDAAKGKEDGTPSCLSRMSGEHGRDAELGDPWRDGVEVVAGRAEAHDRGRHGPAGRDPTGSPIAASEGAHPAPSPRPGWRAGRRC